MINEDTIQHIVHLCIDALLTDGGHHKQWYIERVLEALDVDLDMLRDQVGEWKEGIAP